MPPKLYQADASPSTVLSCGESFEWDVVDGTYCQILFLSPDEKSKVLGDVALCFNWLYDKYMRDSLQQKEELMITVSFFLYHPFLIYSQYNIIFYSNQAELEPANILQFTIQPVNSSRVAPPGTAGITMIICILYFY